MMIGYEIPTSKICNPAAAHVLNSVKDDLNKFDQLESSVIVRSLFGIGAANMTAIDMSMALEATVDPNDQVKIRSLLSDRGTTGVIWRFTSDEKFMIEFSKIPVQTNENVLHLSLIVLHDENKDEPSYVSVRDLVSFGHSGVKFYGKEDRKIKYDYVSADILKRLHEEAKTQPPQPSEEEKTDGLENRIRFTGDQNLIDGHRNQVIQFVRDHHGAINPDDLLDFSAHIHCNISIDYDEEKNLVFTFMTSEPKMSYTVSLHCDETIPTEKVRALCNKCNEILESREEKKFNLTDLQDVLREGGYDPTKFELDYQEEVSDNTTYLKFKVDRTEFPKATGVHYICTLAGYGIEIPEAFKDVDCDLPINYSTEELVNTFNGLFHERGIKDYVVESVHLDGSLDINDYKSGRSWIVRFSPTPEFLETEKLHREAFDKFVASLDKQFDVKQLNGPSKMANGVKSVNDLISGNIKDLQPGWIVGIDPGEIGGDKTVFCGWDGEKWVNVTDSVEAAMKALEEEEIRRKEEQARQEEERKAAEAKRLAEEQRLKEEAEKKRLEEEKRLDTVIIHSGDAYYFIKGQDEDGCEVKIRRYDTNEDVTAFVDPDVKDHNFLTDPHDSYVAKEDITPRMLKEKILSEIMEMFYVSTPAKGEAIEPEPKKEETMDEPKIEVCETLNACKDSLIEALKGILNEYADKATESLVEIGTKLAEISEMDDIEVHYSGDNNWFIDQPDLTGLEETASAEEIPSADIRSQEVQLNLLRGVFGAADPAITHVQKFLRNHLTEIGHEGFMLTESFPTETFIAWDTKPYDFAISIVKFKDGRFYRIFLAYNNPGLEDQSWLATKDIPGRWVKIGRDIQSGEFKPNFQGRRR